jgi:hypothetical protein
MSTTCISAVTQLGVLGQIVQMCQATQYLRIGSSTVGRANVHLPQELLADLALHGGRDQAGRGIPQHGRWLTSESARVGPASRARLSSMRERRARD